MLTHTMDLQDQDYQPVASGLRVMNADRMFWFEPFFATRDAITIGRTRQRDIQVRDDTISRMHCIIVPRRGSYSIVDQDSKNGLYVARYGRYTKVQKVREKRLEVGMHIWIGNATLIVMDQAGQCPLLATRYSEFLRFAAAIYGTAGCAARYVGRSPQAIRNVVNKVQEVFTR